MNVEDVTKTGTIPEIACSESNIHGFIDRLAFDSGNKELANPVILTGSFVEHIKDLMTKYGLSPKIGHPIIDFAEDYSTPWDSQHVSKDKDDVISVEDAYSAVSLGFLLNTQDPLLAATNIQWETDGQDVDLPDAMDISMQHMADIEDISDYISNETGWLHRGFDLVLKNSMYDMLSQKKRIDHYEKRKPHSAYLPALKATKEQISHAIGLLLESSYEQYSPNEIDTLE